MDAGLGKSSSYTWWWDGHSSSSIPSPWLQSALSEQEENILALLAAMKEEDGDSCARGDDEAYHKKKPEIVKRIQDLHRLHCSLVQALDSGHGIGKAAKLEQKSDSSPESSVEDTVLDMHTKYAIPLKQLAETTDEMSISNSVGQIGYMSEASNSVQSFEHRISCSEQTLGLIEENCRHLNELTRRNEEKRESMRDLWLQIKKLQNENQKLHEQNNRLVKEENCALFLELQRVASGNKAQCSRSSSLGAKNNVSLSSLKTLLSSVFCTKGTP